MIPIRTRWTLFPARTRMSLAPTSCHKSIQKLINRKNSKIQPRTSLLDVDAVPVGCERFRFKYGELAEG